MSSDLTHIDARGDARMVEVGGKAVTLREAVAEGWIALSADALQAVRARASRKGDVLAVAQIAGIQGAKRTSDLIPLCHPLPLTGIEVTFEEAAPAGDGDGTRPAGDGGKDGDRTGFLRCQAVVRTEGRTGVEMEALSAVSAALLTVYDMLKAIDKGMEIGPVRLVAKSGGRSGDWRRDQAIPASAGPRSAEDRG